MFVNVSLYIMLLSQYMPLNQLSSHVQEFYIKKRKPQSIELGYVKV